MGCRRDTVGEISGARARLILAKLIADSHSPRFTTSTTPGFHMANTQEEIVKKYWRSNLRLLAVLLTIWFVVSFGCSILFVDELSSIPFFGFDLGFWFSQQGSIYAFVILIVVYVRLMNKLDDQVAADLSGSKKASSEDAA